MNYKLSIVFQAINNIPLLVFKDNVALLYLQTRNFRQHIENLPIE